MDCICITIEDIGILAGVIDGSNARLHDLEKCRDCLVCLRHLYLERRKNLLAVRDAVVVRCGLCDTRLENYWTESDVKCPKGCDWPTDGMHCSLDWTEIPQVFIEAFRALRLADAITPGL